MRGWACPLCCEPKRDFNPKMMPTLEAVHVRKKSVGAQPQCRIQGSVDVVERRSDQFLAKSAPNVRRGIRPLSLTVRWEHECTCDSCY